jgi:arsenate reductase-like glutaredoxin family protein
MRYRASRFRRKNLLPSKGHRPAIRQVKVYANLEDPYCGEIIRYLEGTGLHLQIHDVKKQPLESEQISTLVRQYDLERFLDPSSKPYKKNKLASVPLDREHVIELIANDNDLLRLPIVVAGGRISIGFDLRQIMGTLHIRAGDVAPVASK